MKLISTAILVVGAACCLPAATISWEGQTWDIIGTGSAVVNGSGNLVLTVGSNGETDVHLNRVLPAAGVFDSFINQFGTPQIAFSYIDPGASDKVDFFMDTEGGLNPRLQAGSLFSFQGLGYTRFGPVPTEDVVFFQGSGLRAPGQAHTIS